MEELNNHKERLHYEMSQRNSVADLGDINNPVADQKISSKKIIQLNTTKNISN